MAEHEPVESLEPVEAIGEVLEPRFDEPVEPGILEPIVPHPPERFGAPVEFDEPVGDVSIGVVVPFDFGLDWEYWRYLPERVSLFFTRTPHLNKTVGIELAKSVGKPSVVARATKALNALEPAVTLYACSSGSFVHGPEGERQIRQAMLEAGARHAVTSAGAMLEAMHAASAERVAIASPYSRALTERLVAFLEASGVEVPSVHYLGLSTDIGRVSRRTIAELVRESHHPRADLVFVSCTSLRTHGIVAELEHEIERPVFTSNQVSLWAAVKAAGAEFLDPAQPGWVIGGGSPMARSTRLLIDAARREAHEGVA